MISGIVSFYNAEQKYGFIKSDAGEDLFFHLSSYRGDEKNLAKLARVDFEVADGNEKRRKAISIRIEGDKSFEDDFTGAYRKAYLKLKARKMLTDDEVEDILFYLPIPNTVS